MSDVSYPLAFAAGFLSFVSACVLPVVPSYVSLVTGLSFEELTSQGVDRKRVRLLTLFHSSLFVLGFSSVFIALGASSSYVGSALLEYRDWLRITGGIVVIVFGLFIAGFINLRSLMRERRFLPAGGRPKGAVGTFLVGTAFAAGWTPCIGPILGSILLVASAKASTLYGVKLLSAYSAGLAVPFLASSLALSAFLSYSKRLMRYMRPIKVASGVILILFGVVLLTDQLGTITAWFPGIDFEL
ncbi:MAG: cytochrome c biogenesis protein CcdA [Thermodesulfovibrionales bacterium]